LRNNQQEFGDIKEIQENYTVAELLAELKIEGKRLAVEINEEIIPRSQFEHKILSTGDKVEIVQAIGGG